MMSSNELARRYVLGDASEDERDALEQAYFSDPAKLDDIESAEERLIEAYLAGELNLQERARFEREYLSLAHRRRRVETVRRLIRSASLATPAPLPKPHWSLGYLAVAASLLLTVFAGWWIVASRSAVPATAPSAAPTSAAGHPQPPSPQPAQPAAAPPRIIALALSPIHTRSEGETPSVAVPAGTDFVELTLQDGGGAPMQAAKAVLQTVGGLEVWRGDVEKQPPAPGVVAHVRIPAARLTTEDYIVTLFEEDARNVEHERYRYFFRVRPR
jgi:hypothetical protein